MTALALGGIWFRGVQSLSTLLGLLTAGVAIALRDPLVEIGGHRGDVIDLRIFQFSLLEIGNWVDADQSTGRIINIPNGKVFTDSLANYTRGFDFIWDELPVLVTFESDWEKAKGLQLAIAQRHGAIFSESAEATWEEILREFRRHDDIDFAYPTRRWYDNRTEGKPGARAGGAAPPRDEGPDA